MFFLYELSNWCVNLAGLLLLKDLFARRTQEKWAALGTSESLMVSKDMAVLLWISQLCRAYWGMSPPEIWLHDETDTTKYVVLIDFACSVLLWTVIGVGFLLRGGKALPWKLRWWALALVASVFAYPGSFLVEAEPE